MAEVHIIGEIVEAQEFEDRSLFAKWSLAAGSCWRALEGETAGQTQLSVKHISSSEGTVEDNNTDVHYLTKGLQGWPKMELQVWGVDWLGKCNISAYGFVNVPSLPGYHELECHTWRPVGDFRRRVIDYVTGYRMHLVNPSEIISDSLNRHVIQSESMGTLRINLTVVLKDFDQYDVDLD